MTKEIKVRPIDTIQTKILQELVDMVKEDIPALDKSETLITHGTPVKIGPVKKIFRRLNLKGRFNNLIHQRNS